MKNAVRILGVCWVHWDVVMAAARFLAPLGMTREAGMKREPGMMRGSGLTRMSTMPRTLCGGGC